MSNHSDPKSQEAAKDFLKATAAAKREHPDPTESQHALPSSLLLLFGAIVCFAGAYFGIYHGGFQGNVFNESESTPDLLSSSKKGAASAEAQPAAELSLVEQGKAIYAQCQTCHQPNGLGIAGQFPPLAGSDWVTGSEKRLVAILLKGLGGPIKVGSATYNGVMPPWEKTLSDKKIAAVASYVRATWGNAAPEITEAKVAAAKKEFASRVDPWTEADLLAIPEGAAIEGAAATPAAPAAAPAKPAGPAPAGGTPTAAAAPAAGAVDLDAGKAQYMAICVACHQPTGMGLPPVFPPLVGSDYVKGDPERLVAIVLNGVIGPIEVDGKQYNNLMPPQGLALSDTKISQVTSWVRATFGSGASPITVEQVAAARQKYGTRATGWTEAELKAFPPKN